MRSRTVSIGSWYKGEEEAEEKEVPGRRLRKGRFWREC